MALIVCNDSGLPYSSTTMLSTMLGAMPGAMGVERSTPPTTVGRTSTSSKMP